MIIRKPGVLHAFAYHHVTKLPVWFVISEGWDRCKAVHGLTDRELNEYHEYYEANTQAVGSYITVMREQRELDR